MSNHTFFLVDVFAQKRYTGNQLAVIINAERLMDSEMQKIANEMHFSETTFIKTNKPSNDGYYVRIFTPSTELPFAGHPTLGTAYIIKHFIAEKSTQNIILNLKVGQIKVTFEKQRDNQEICWMKQISPVFGKTFTTNLFQQLLGLQEEDFDVNFPIQEISTGLPFIIIPLNTLEAMKRTKINQNFLPELTKQIHAGILVFCPQTYNKENKLNVRVFVDVFGIPEDPATGSGNGCLAAYLAQYRYFGSSDLNIKVEQGFEINRPSILQLKADKVGSKIQVYVGGKVLLVAKGKLLT